MPLEITYWTGLMNPLPVVNSALSSEQRTLSGTSAQSGLTPQEAALVSIVATENARIDYGSASPTATAASAYIAAGERLWLKAYPGRKIAGITA